MLVHKTQNIAILSFPRTANTFAAGMDYGTVSIFVQSIYGKISGIPYTAQSNGEQITRIYFIFFVIFCFYAYFRLGKVKVRFTSQGYERGLDRAP